MKSGYVEQQELTFCLDRVRTDQTKSGFPVTEIWVENCEHTLKNISSRICYTRGDNYVFLYIILVTCWLFVALLQIKYSKLTTIYLKCKSDQNEITETLTAIFFLLKWRMKLTEPISLLYVEHNCWTCSLLLMFKDNFTWLCNYQNWCFCPRVFESNVIK